MKRPSPPPRPFKIAGVPIEVVSDEQAERADFVICVTAAGPAYFRDDVLTACAGCGTAIRHRPSAPKRPPKVCLSCAVARFEKESKA